jgi:hypothetical protein
VNTGLRNRARRQVAAAAGTALLAGVLVPALGAVPATAAPLPAPVAADTSALDPKHITLSWSAVEGATGYTVQVGTEESWSDVPTYERDTVATQLTLPTWLPHADYVWRVSATSDAGRGRWSPTSYATSFERGWAAKATTKLTVDQHGVPTFSWTPVPHASEYQLQVSNVSTFSDDASFRDQAGVVTQSCFTTRTRLSFLIGHAKAKNPSAGECAIDLIAQGKPFYWRVRALDHHAEEAQEVDTTPVVDEGISHLPPSSKPGELDLTACPGTSTKPDASAPSPAASPVSDEPVDPEKPAEPQAGPCEPANPVEKGAWSATKRHVASFAAIEEGDFRTLPKVQTGPLPAGLCTGTVCRDFPTITWSAVPGASSYRVYVSLDRAYTNLQEVIDTPALEWTPTTAWRDSSARQSYYYVVQPCTSEGCGDVTSTPPSFRKMTPPVRATSPADAANVTAHDVRLAWTDHAAELASATGAPATSGAFAYHVQVAKADNPDFHAEQLVDEATVDATSYVSPDKRYDDGEYVWRVQAIDASNHRLPWSEARTFFRDRTPPTVLRISPQGWTHADGEIRMRFSEPVIGVSAETVTLSGAPATVTQLEPTLVSIRLDTVLRPGAGHRLRVSSDVRDVAGNPLVAYDTPLVVGVDVEETSRVFSWAGPWTPSISTQAGGGSFARAVADGRTHTAVDFDFTGFGVVLLGCKGPANGIVEIWVDGALHSRVDGYAPFSSCGGALATVNGLPWAAHHVQVRGIGAKQPASSGTVVGLDGIHVIR